MRGICLLLLGLLPLAVAAEIRGRVVAVPNGDTLNVLVDEKTSLSIRLLGIDAPDGFQEFAAQSRTSLAAQAMGQDVRIGEGRPDRAGRVQAQVWTTDTGCRQAACPKMSDLGLVQVAAGMAWRDPQQAEKMSPPDRQRYAEAEFMAKIRRLGLWSGKNPQPPWSRQRYRLDE